MNEEELDKYIKGKFEEIHSKMLNKQFVSAGTLIRFRDACFQKGKEEARKEELEFLKSIRNNQSIGMQENINRLCISSERLKQGYISIELNLYLDKRIKQLQKEIGGNSK